MGPLKKDLTRAGGGEGVGERSGSFVRVLRVLEALGGSFVRILRALRPWEARTYVFYEVLKPPGFEGPGCGVVNLTWIGAQPSRGRP